jgi:hypothetical protein
MFTLDSSLLIIQYCKIPCGLNISLQVFSLPGMVRVLGYLLLGV